jgi:hypothetical protein
MFITKGHAERVELLGRLPRPLFVYASSYFRSFYGIQAGAILNDSCFRPLNDPFLFEVVCASSQKPSTSAL